MPRSKAGVRPPSDATANVHGPRGSWLHPLAWRTKPGFGGGIAMERDETA